MINDTITSPGCEEAVDEDDADDSGTGGDDTDTSDGDTDGATDTDGTDATGDDASDSDVSNGSSNDGNATVSDADSGGRNTGSGPALPETGGPNLWPLVAGATALGAGTLVLRRRRYQPTHAASSRMTDGEN